MSPFPRKINEDAGIVKRARIQNGADPRYQNGKVVIHRPKTAGEIFADQQKKKDD